MHGWELEAPPFASWSRRLVAYLADALFLVFPRKQTWHDSATRNVVVRTS